MFWIWTLLFIFMDLLWIFGLILSLLYFNALMLWCLMLHFVLIFNFGFFFIYWFFLFCLFLLIITREWESSVPFSVFLFLPFISWTLLTNQLCISFVLYVSTFLFIYLLVLLHYTLDLNFYHTSSFMFGVLKYIWFSWFFHLLYSLTVKYWLFNAQLK